MADERERTDGRDEAVERTFERSVDEGVERLNRTWPSLLATGSVGAFDVGVGVVGLLIVRHATGDELLGSLAFTFGFVALALASSELFTENFLIPIAAMLTRDQATPRKLARLWGGTLAMNLLAGWVMMVLVVNAFPQFSEVTREVASVPIRQGIGVQSLASAMLGGVVITLMTWMEQGTESVPAKLLAVIGAAFLLAAGPLDHVVVISLEIFGALLYGASFGYADWAGTAAFAALGNLLGGVGLVTVLRLVQVGSRKMGEEREIDDGSEDADVEREQRRQDPPATEGVH